MNLKLQEVPRSEYTTNTAGTETADKPGVKRATPRTPVYCAAEIHILVVDDEAAVANLIKESLTRPHFFIDTVTKADQVETQLRARPYHLVILDYVIPGLKPEEVFEWLRQEQPDASVIVVTGFPSLDSVVSCLRARADDYLTKPFDLGQLERVVRNCLENKGLIRLSEEALRESLGAAIRERRKNLGLTLAQMAERTNISFGYLSQIELGKNSASIETLYRICLGLGIKMAELFQVVRW